jgi:hypothetical protein
MKRFSEILRRARSGVAAMPLLMRMLCGIAMLASPILLVALCLPIVSFSVGGKEVAFQEIWRSGLGVILWISLLLSGLASWGLALRRPIARWFAVAGPIAPIAVAALLPHSAVLSHYQQPNAILLALPYAMGMYFCLFHVQSVRRYLFEVAPATTPNKIAGADA